MPRPGRFAPSKVPEPSVQDTGWAPGPVWVSAEKSSSGSDTRTFQPEPSHYTD